jgi:hypothetical protein
MSETPFKPRRAPMRAPTSNEKQNGRIENPPRYPEIGGFTSAGRGFRNNRMKVRKPGDAA